MQRLALREGWVIDDLFSGQGHAPAPLTVDERAALSRDLGLSDAARHDMPDWLWPAWQDSLGAAARQAALTLQGRAEVFLRVNQRRGTVSAAQVLLAQAGIQSQPHSHIAGCLRVTENARRIKTSPPYLDGLVELQDGASQHAVNAVPLSPDARVLDYCAGGGGKALAFADRAVAGVFAHDIAPKRMLDLPERAKRAGVAVTVLTGKDVAQQAPFDVVFCDAPCSGSGTWRRAPDAKWRLAPESLTELMQSQAAVLNGASGFVKAGGVLVYATCSVLTDENTAAVQGFLSCNRGFILENENSRIPDQAGDGFYFAHLRKQKTT